MDEFGLIVLLCIITFVIAIWSYLIGHDAGFRDGFYNGGMEHPALKNYAKSASYAAHINDDDATCPECTKKMSKKLMVYIEMPNGDFGWYCSYKCAKEEMDGEMFLHGEEKQCK